MWLCCPCVGIRGITSSPLWLGYCQLSDSVSMHSVVQRPVAVHISPPAVLSSNPPSPLTSLLGLS